MKTLVLVASIFLAIPALAETFAPSCSVTYSKNPYAAGLYIYHSVCFYNEGLSQEIQSAWVSLPNDTAALIDECEAQCRELAKRHPNGF